MDNLQASPRNSLGYLADMLASVKGFGDKAHVPDFVPLIGGTGLGELLMGKSPELMDDMSYNPSAAIRGGNRATGGLGTYTLDKRSADLGMTVVDAASLAKLTSVLGKAGMRKLADKSGFDATRRAFIEGQGIGLNKPTNETVVNAASSALSPLDEILHTQVTRRNVLKGAAAAGGLAATPALLRNFVKDAGHVAPKAAAHVADNAAVSPVKHKFNSLAEYLDDIQNRAKDIFNSPNKAYRAEDEIARDLLHSDEIMYDAAKEHQNFLKKSIGDGWEEAPAFTQNQLDRLDAFSPKAKAEMKAYKNMVTDQVQQRKALDYFKDPEYMPYDEWGSHLEARGMDLEDATRFGIEPPIPNERATAIEKNYLEKSKSASPFEAPEHWTPDAYDEWKNWYPNDFPF